LVALAPVVSSADEAIEVVVVTGSRIRSATDRSASPVAVLTEDQLTRGANDSLGKVLQTLPYNSGAPTNTNVNNSGDGSTRIDLRGLGPQRTLVLLNGRRLPNGGIGADASVDLDSLPLSMVERVEVLTTGASAVYGADAIGGVVNVITRSHFSGIELGAQASQSGHGDGAIARAEALAGGGFGRGQWMLGVDYVDQRRVATNARSYSATPLTIGSPDGIRVPFGSPWTGEGRFRVGPGNLLGLSPGRYTRVAGATGQTASDWRPVTEHDFFNYTPYTYLQTPNQRGSAWLLGHAPLGESLEFFTEGLFNYRRSSQGLAPTPFMVQSNAAPLLADGTPGIPADNYYNPFGVDITQGGRRLVELSNRGFHERVMLWRALAGLRGHLGSWAWEASAAISESDALTRELGVPAASRLAAGLGPSGPDASGQIVCGEPNPNSGIVPATAVISGCVPINVFGGAGSMTQPQLDYLSRPLEDRGTNSQRLFDVGIEGAWGRMPAGAIRWALGSEFRRESGAYRYDPERVGGGVGDGLNADIPGGSFDAREAYAEVRLPLLDRQHIWGNADASLGARISDFSSFGTHTTTHAGLRWQPSSAWAVRADFETLFRAPSLAELYEAQFADATLVPRDPCGRSPSSQQQIHCAANGVPGGSYVQDTGASAIVQGGGNGDLRPEQGDSFDAGVEFRSTGAIAWRSSLDYFHTRLDHFIESGSANQILAECATYGTPVACANIQRFNDGTLRSVDTRYHNLGRITLRGLDVSESVSVTTRAGDLKLYMLATHLMQYDAQIFENGETVHRVGYGNSGLILPKWRALGAAALRRGHWGLSYTAQWIGGYTDCSDTLDGGVYCNRVPSVIYHDIETLYELGTFAVHAGVNNLTDRNPPYLDVEGNTNPALYRLLGRTYFLQLRYTLSR
jgi:outer membrane receptor protein involved in Fe transport